MKEYFTLLKSYITRYLYFRKKRYHLIDTKLDPYSYYDIDERMFHGMFQLLNEFVDIECAHMYEITYDDESNIKIDKSLAGLEYLYRANKDVSSIVDNSWMKEVIDLYLWYKDREEVYHNDYTKLGYPEYFEDAEYNETFGIYVSKLYYDKYNALEELHNKVDTENLIRLIKIRRYLWT